MNKNVKDFINKYEHLIDDNMWDELYKLAAKELDANTGLLTDALFGADIYPLEYLNYIPEAFCFGSQLTEIEIPEGIKTISVDAFGDCKIKHIKLPSTLTTIDNEAIAYCSELTEINLPDSIDLIGDDAFACCKKLKSIHIPAKLKVINAATFSMCLALSDVDMSLANNLERIETKAFANCANLDELFIPPSVTYIANKALPDHTDILCKENSYAHEYAIAKDRFYKLV